MSRIDELIAEHCPDGVEFLTVSELFDIKNGYTPSKSNEDFWKGGEVPWFRMEDIRAHGRVLGAALQQIPRSAVKGGRLFPANSLLFATSATIGEHALVTVPHLSNQRFTSLAVKPEHKPKVDVKFLHYYGFILDEWCLSNTTTSSFASVDMNGFKRFRFPIPHLEVQLEIVRILDDFTQLEAELEAELEARRKQYEHYRNQLLTFPEGGVRWVPMGEVGEFIRGNGLQKSDLTDAGVPAIHYGQIHTRYGTWISETISFVDPEKSGKLKKAKHGDLVIATTSEDDGAVAKATAWLGPNEVAVSGDALIFNHTLNPKYVAYFFQTTAFQDQKKRHVSGTKVRRISVTSLAKLVIPVPSLTEQERIVSILDKFDALVNDLSVGLPAELVARRKQYEYFRDTLLTFKELAA